MNNVFKDAVEITLLSLLTKKTIQPLRTQLWTSAKMVFSCWLAFAATVAPHMDICAVAIGTAVVSPAKADVTDEASCRPLDMMTEKTLKMFAAAASCTSCAAWLLTFIKFEYT